MKNNIIHWSINTPPVSQNFWVKRHFIKFPALALYLSLSLCLRSNQSHGHIHKKEDYTDCINIKMKNITHRSINTPHLSQNFWVKMHLIKFAALVLCLSLCLSMCYHLTNLLIYVTKNINGIWVHQNTGLYYQVVAVQPPL